MKIILLGLTVLSLVVSGALGVPAFGAPPVPAESTVTTGPNGEAVATEETSAIERAIEGKVHDVLDGILKSDKYAVYVQVTLKADVKTLESYYAERELSTLPGIPAPDPELNNPANDKLYSMIQSRKVIVVLDKLVSGEQELVAKDVLKAKLALNDKKGDVLEFRRSEVPTSVDRAIASAPPAQRTEDWVRNVLFSLAAALIFAIGIMLWQISILRERLEARAKLKADIKLDSATDTTTNTSPAGGAKSDGEEIDISRPMDQQRKILPMDPVSIVELKEKILSLAVAQPKASSLVARRLMGTREGMKKLAVACEAIGFEYAKQLFDTVSPAKWRAMGEYLRQNMTEMANAPVGQILMEIYTDMLAESMGWDPSKNIEGPFDFLHKLTDVELNRLFENEDANHIAFVAAFWEPEEMSGILGVLGDGKRKEAILQIARLHSLPKEIVEQAALGFADRLKALRSRQEVDVDGSQIVARMLNSVDNGSEDEILRFIEREDPAARDRLRAHYFSFDSLPIVPTEVLATLFENYSTERLTQALSGADEQVVGAVLAVLPPKQRSIVEDDVRLANSQNTVSKQDMIAARREMVVDIRKALKDRGIELSQLGANATSNNTPENQFSGFVAAAPLPPHEQQAVENTGLTEAPTDAVIAIDPASDGGTNSGQAA